LKQCEFETLRQTFVVEKLRSFLFLPFFKDFRRRFVSLLSFQFSNFKPATALQVLRKKKKQKTETNSPIAPPTQQPLKKLEMDFYLTSYDMKRLEMYSRSMVDYHLIMDLLPTLARIYFLEKIKVSLSVAQKVLNNYLCISLVHRRICFVAEPLFSG